jgi:AmmeMemoRadiSam system protein A
MSQLNEAEQRQLLDLARQAIEAAVRHHVLPEPLPDAADLKGPLREHHAAFVTLRKGHELRGCVGCVETTKPLYETVRECAVAAALHDFRFQPVRPDELPYLHLEVSVLSPLSDIEVDHIEVGQHGLLISHQGRRGLLLPQVAVEWNWDRKQFLDATARKAGLPQDCWRQGARIQAFTTQVFAESVDTAGRDSRRI